MSDVVDSFFPKRPSTQFTVRNICPNKKTVRVFHYPIPYGCERDLLAIPAVSEADIRHSLLKGSLYIKFMADELEVVFSDIDLLQFNDDQKNFLISIGITKGLEISGSGGGITPDQHETLRQLIHLADNGPYEGFNNTYREIQPQNNPFPTNITWYSDATKNIKIVEKQLTYDSSKRITTITWIAYDELGNTLATVLDTITYSGTSPFESSRIRTVS